jgi:hypothetical protein
MAKADLGLPESRNLTRTPVFPMRYEASQSDSDWLQEGDADFIGIRTDTRSICSGPDSLDISAESEIPSDSATL